MKRNHIYRSKGTIAENNLCTDWGCRDKRTKSDQKSSITVGDIQRFQRTAVKNVLSCVLSSLVLKKVENIILIKFSKLLTYKLPAVEKDVPWGKQETITILNRWFKKNTLRRCLTLYMEMDGFDAWRVTKSLTTAVTAYSFRNIFRLNRLRVTWSKWIKKNLV